MFFPGRQDIQRYSFAARPGRPTLATSYSRPVRCRAAVARRMIPQVAERLKEVMLENIAWDRFVKLYDSPGTFFFVDPPYLGHNEYRHNFKAADFESLAAALKSINGRFLMTHTDGPEIREMFAGLNFEAIEVAYSTHQLTPGHDRQIGQEVLISNY